MENDAVEGRAKRQKLDKTGRFAALQKLKEHKQRGSKHKYEVDNIENVYEVVDEREYTKEVLNRQEENWIVDDDGSGYVEDGRDIFDDDLDSASIAAASKSKGSSSKKRKAVSENAGRGNLQFMLSSMPSKKKETVNLGEDDILSELIQEIDVNQSDLDQTSNKTSLLNEKQAAKNYMNSFSVPKPPKVTLTPMKMKKIEKPTSMKIFKSESILAKVQNNQSKSDAKVESKDVTKPIDEPLDSFDDIAADFDTNDFDANDFELLDQLEDSKTPRYENLPLKSNHIEEPSQKIGNSQTNIESSQLNDEYMTQIEEYKSVKEQDETITEEQLLEGWNTMREGCNQQEENIPIVNVESGNIPLQENEDGKKVFRFFWWDAFEDRRIQPGVVFLFGKTYCEVAKSYVSCCVAVRNILRKIFLLPRPTFKFDCNKEVTLLDVYHEFNNNIKLDTFKSKKTTKNYPFDPDVPLQSEYLEVRYSAKSPQIPEEFLSGNTYSKIFGLNTSYLEILLLDQKIKGPCWLEVAEPESVSNKISWCKYEVNCNTSNNLTVKSFMKNTPSPPPLTVATINTRTIVSHNTKTGSAKNEIVMITCLVQNKYFVDKQAPNPPFQQHFCVITRPDGKALPLNFHDSLQKYKGTRVQKMDSEKALLTYFINQLNNIDPDLIVGHDLQGYQLDLFCNRLTQLGIRHFSKLGRLKRGAIPPHGKFGKELFCGRLVCDVKVSAHELIKSRSYDLDALCQTVLKVQDGSRLSLEVEDIGRMYQNSQDLLKLITLTMQDTAFILKIMYELNVIPLALQITNIAGNVMSRTLLGGRSERNEFLLLHAFTEKDYLVPDKEFMKKVNKDETDTEIPASKRKKPTYSGGLVLDPKVGFYDTLILLMDFNSLYPSIIQEYNVCFTTLIQNGDVISFSMANTGVLPTEIRKLVESRRDVKKLMKNPDLNKDVYMQYNIRQTALKLTANSMYGCLGFSNSRFFAKHLAAFITQRGREILTNTKDTVEKMTFEVIYGDTDSIMINTNCLDYDQVFKVGNKIKIEINKLYKQVELDIDGVFKYLLLLKKKKYAAVTLSKMKNGQLKVAQEHKGLDIVRRDWSQLSAEAGKIILNHILSDQTIEEKITNVQQHLTKLKSDLEENVVPLPLLVITKQLTKNPKEYSEKNALTHVQVALRYNSKGGKQLQNGDTVPYIICEDGTSNAATQRGYHIEEFKNSTTLKLDVKYYLAQQIHPVISRLCSPIPELDSYQIANWLGLDTTHFKKPNNNESSSINKNDMVQYNDEIRYRNCEPFIFTCYFCKHLNTITDLIMDNQPFLNKCMNQECSVRPLDYLGNVQNQLSLAINKYIRKFYQFEMTCEDPSCTYDTNHVSTRIFNKYTVCKMCNEAVMYVKYPAKDLHMQLMYFQKLVDVGKHSKKHLVNSSLEVGYNALKETVDRMLIHSNFNVINLEEMFAPFAHKKEYNGKTLETTKIEDEDFDDPEENDDE
nr:DNA polymerase alpha catalytic subunit [Onthophagus taurus]